MKISHLMILIMTIVIIALKILKQKSNVNVNNQQQIIVKQNLHFKNNLKPNQHQVHYQSKQNQYNFVQNTPHSKQINNNIATKRLLIIIKNITTRQKYYNQRPCPNITVIYTWVGNTTMPSYYQNYIKRCADKIKLLGNKELQTYINLWNNHTSKEFIINTTGFPSNLLSTYLRKIYLYFQGGIYADFDTQLDQRCYKDIKTDQILFTNWSSIKKGINVGEQNFLMVLKKFNPQMKKMIQNQTKQKQIRNNRWDQCINRQCLIINCQKHDYQKTWWPNHQLKVNQKSK